MTAKHKHFVGPAPKRFANRYGMTTVLYRQTLANNLVYIYDIAGDAPQTIGMRASISDLYGFDGLMPGIVGVEDMAPEALLLQLQRFTSKATAAIRKEVIRNLGWQP